MAQGKRYGPKGYIPKFERGISRGVAQTKPKTKSEMPDKFKKKIAMRKIKNVAKDVFNKKNGGRTMKDFSGDGKITQKDVLMGRGVIPKPKKNGGITEGIRKIKGMKHGGQCRGMGAAKRGGKFHEA